MALHTRLCRIASESHHQHEPALRLLASHLSCLPLQTAQQRTFAVHAAVELIASLCRAIQSESLREGPGESLNIITALPSVDHALRPQNLISQ